MTIINQILTSTASGSFAPQNDMIGQIKAYLILDPNVQIISDNNPDSTIARVLLYSVGGSSHYYKLYATTSNINFQLLKIDGVTSLDINKAQYVITSNYVIFRFLYNANTHLITLGASPTENNPPYAFTFNTGDPSGWYIHISNFSGASVYPANSETIINVDKVSYTYLETGGKFVGIPRRYYQGGIMNPYVHNYIWFSGNLLTGGLLTDTIGKQYISYSDTNNGILVKDP
jgi:hypothetical protein